MRTIAVLCILLFFFADVAAQDKQWTFGIKGGLDWASFIGKDVNVFSYSGEVESLTGQVVGFSASKKLSKYFGLRNEIVSARRFLNVTLTDINNTPYSSNIKRQYVEILPANPTFYIKGFQFYTGAYLAILLNASIQREDSSGKLYKDKSFYYSTTTADTYANRFDAGIAIGLEYQFKIGLTLAAHFNRGFIPAVEHRTQQNGIFNQFLGISLGYNFCKRHQSSSI